MQIYGVYKEGVEATLQPSLAAATRALEEAELAKDVLDKYPIFLTLHEHTHIANANVLRLSNGPDPDGRAAKSLAMLKIGIKTLKKGESWKSTNEHQENDAGLAMR